MAWPYHFVDTTSEQNSRRRFLLDNYGQFAQLSVLLLPLLYQLLLGIRLLSSRLSQRRSYQPVKDHQSPVPSQLRVSQRHAPSWTWRKFKWWLDSEVATDWGTRKEWLFAAFWTAWLCLLVVRDTGDDYLHVTRRFGIVAASQLPIHYLLAAKAWSPIQYLTRMSHEELNPYHRMLGRIIVLLMACHATLYLNFYIQKGLLLKRIQDWDVILGLSAITSATLLFTGAFSQIRNLSYRLFFYSHVALSIILLPILYLHVSHLRIYILETVAVYALLILQRNISQTTFSAKIHRIPHTNLLSITIPLNEHFRSRTYSSWRNYSPGQHIYIGFPAVREKLRINPFTIAIPPSQATSSESLKLVVRSLSGTTAMLDDLASSANAHSLLTVEGPYGAAKYFPDLAEKYDRILLVAGGVGATFILPIYEQIIATATADTRVKLVRAVRERGDADWGDPDGSGSVGGERGRIAGTPGSVVLKRDIELYLTGATSPERQQTMYDDDQSIELQQRSKPAIPNNDDDKQDRLDSGQDLSSKAGRPNFHKIVDELFDDDDRSDSVAVLVCGPKGMGASLRREVGRWVGAGRDVFWHSEEFGW